MRLCESELRAMIRNILGEQVVGYSAPSKGGAAAGDTDGYMDIGDSSVMTSPEDESSARHMGKDLSIEDENQLRANIATLQQQRAAALKKGDSASAIHLGTMMQRMQDTLNG